MAQAPTVDEYIAGLPADRRVPMEELRRTVKAAAPDATEVITYKMPGLRDAGGFLVSYDSYKNHYSLFPATDAVIAALGDEVRPYLSGKGTIRFPADRPLPLELVARIVEVRVQENAAAASSRKSRARPAP
jgi:uncharacterized protein YdhG (YjbR/CyaY superfamily)